MRMAGNGTVTTRTDALAGAISVTDAAGSDYHRLGPGLSAFTVVTNALGNDLLAPTSGAATHGLANGTQPCSSLMTKRTG